VKHPFDEELSSIARGFGSLLREIIETIDRWGLKRHHLRKHSRAAERFLNEVASMALLDRGGGSAQEEDRQEPRETAHFPGLRWSSLEQQQR
jgi:hypothetical protein